jgi:hypothetical protein
MAKRRTFEDPETRKFVFVNVMGEDKKPGQLHTFLFPNGEMLIETKAGECIHLTRSQTVDLYTFFDGSRVKKRMLDVLRAWLLKQGDTCRDFIHSREGAALTGPQNG